MKRLSTILCALVLLFGVVGVANASEIKTPILLLKGGTINTTDFTVTPLAPSTLTTDNLYAATFTSTNGNPSNTFQYKDLDVSQYDKIVIKLGETLTEDGAWQINLPNGSFTGLPAGINEYEVDLTGVNTYGDFTIFSWFHTGKSITISECYFVETGGVKQQTKLAIAAGWDTAVEDIPELTGNVVYNYKNAYAAVNLISSGTISTSDYKGFELELGDGAPVDKLQINFGSDKGEGNVEDYTGPINTLSYKGNFPTGAITVSKISLQACNVADLGRVEIKSFYLIDNSDNKVATTYETPASCAADIIVYNATLSYTTGGQWTYGALKGGEGILLPVTITVNAESFPENVQFNITTPAQVPDWQGVLGDRHEYRGLPAGGTTCSVDIDAVEDGETIKAIELQHTAATDPFKIKQLSGTISQYRKITVGSAGYTTFSPKLPVTVEGIVTAYGAKYDGSKIVLTPVTEIPAGSGVIIEAAENSYKAPVINKAGSLSAINDLLVSDGTVTGDGSTIYALGKKGDKVGFLRVANGVTIPAGKAYLVISAGAREFIGFGEDATGVETIKQEAKADNQYFNLSGQRVAQPTKGLYIVNGKKVIIK